MKDVFIYFAVNQVQGEEEKKKIVEPIVHDFALTGFPETSKQRGTILDEYYW
jgi:hypothetical protein